jgi:hypothetical protein
MHPLHKMRPHCNVNIGWGVIKIPISIMTTYDQMVKWMMVELESI